jgi:murein DD-endopeptidase MepM/ murein hydrolase activator NlpD
MAAGGTLPGMRWWAAFMIMVVWLLPADMAVAGPALPSGPGPSGPGPGAPAPVTPAGGYRAPLAGSIVVTRPFEPPPRPWLPGHRGVDLAASPGAAVLAAGAGVIAFAGTVAGVGVVSIDHAGGLRTTYEPVTPLVPAGTRVDAGRSIGVLLPGHEGCPVAACLHWGLRRGADYLDPLLLLRAVRMRLYPLDAEPSNVASRSGSFAASRSYSSVSL